MKRLTVKGFTAIPDTAPDTGLVRGNEIRERRKVMSLETTSRERARTWLLASGIALLVVAIFAAAILVGGAAASEAREVRSALPAFQREELPKEWRWERKAITFDHMFRQLGN